MASGEKLLTIAIPTYNRSEYLDKTIESIVRDPLFSEGEVELVVSDNCSVDNTRQVVMKYQEQYDHIIYHRNDENIRDANFVKVLSLGQGTFLKLYNDTALFLDGTIAFLLNVIKKNIEDKPVMCFPNAELPHISITETECNSFEEFVNVMSFYSTWIAAFGIWKEDFNQLTDIYRSVPLQLWQTDILFRLVSQKQSVIVYNQKLVQIQTLQKKGGYNIFEVFANNYLSLYKEYLVDEQLSKSAFRKEKRHLFRYFFLGWIKILRIKKNDTYDFEIGKGINILYKHYKTYLIFYAGLIYLAIYGCFHFLSKK